MSEATASLRGPDEPPPVPPSGTGGTSGSRNGWRGPTYYGRAQLKEAPFNNWVVGGYVFLAGLAGACSVLAAAADSTRPLQAAAIVRRGRYLPLLAPSLGAALLIWDLHTPQRFYNMFRVAKRTSPMSIGTWILTGFSLTSMASATLQFLADRVPELPWLRTAARRANVPAAAFGAGMSTYTASLLAATSTPLWAASPRSLAARFAASSFASAASAMALPEPEGPAKRSLDTVAVAALTAELALDAVQAVQFRRRGVAGALSGRWGVAEKLGATGLGTAAPIALHLLARLGGARGGSARLAAALALGGSFLYRVSIMSAGDTSARTPEISFRFAQPDNLPAAYRKRERRGRRAAGVLG